MSNSTTFLTEEIKLRLLYNSKSKLNNFIFTILYYPLIAIETNTVSNLPFYSLSDKEFKALFGSWSRRKNNDFDVFDLFLNPDKSDESYPDHILYNPCSEYFSIDKLKKILETMPNSLSILHCNIRSLPKNLNILEDILYSLE